MSKKDRSERADASAVRGGATVRGIRKLLYSLGSSRAVVTWANFTYANFA